MFFKVVSTLNTGINANGLDITPDNCKLYVANNNNYGLTNQASVTVICLKTNTVINTIYDSSFNQPYTINIDEKGKRAYVTNSANTTVSVISVKHDKVIS